MNVEGITGQKKSASPLIEKGLAELRSLNERFVSVFQASVATMSASPSN
jgi:hypothetical protein